MSWMTSLRALPLATICLGLLVVGGCGPAGAPKTVKTKLKAQYDDGTALPSTCILLLHPASGEAEYTVAAGMPMGGEYTLGTNYKDTDIDGAPPGKYKVTVRNPGVTGATVGGGGVKSPTPECGDEKTTPLEITISESGEVTPNPLKVPLAKNE